MKSPTELLGIDEEQLIKKCSKCCSLYTKLLLGEKESEEITEEIMDYIFKTFTEKEMAYLSYCWMLSRADHAMGGLIDFLKNLKRL